MKSYLNLLLVASSCAKHETVQKEFPTFSYEQVQTFMHLQEQCEQLNYIFQEKYFIMSQEPFVEREKLLKEIAFHFPWETYPESLERCISDLQSH